MKRVKKIGITPDQYIALRWVHEFSDEMVSQAKLAELMCTDANNIAGIMKRMEIMKLIKRKKNPIDNRQKVIFPTTKGTLIFQKGKIIADKLEKEILSCLSSKEKKHFLALLDQLYSAIDSEKYYP
jgi:DNA-binding MarR family transcriptional regulator